MRKIDEAYQFIKEYITEKDFPPTIREIGEALGVSSTSTVSYYLRKLEEQNRIVKGSYKNRSIQLMENITTRDNMDIITIPLIKGLEPGHVLLSERNIGSKYMISGSIFKGFDIFMVPVSDNCMENSAILQGDMVVVSRQNVAQNGEIVVALIDSNYKIGRLYKQYNHFILKPDSKSGVPIYAEKMMILGKVVGVIRNRID